MRRVQQVWDASIALAMIVVRSSATMSYLELGCGCALPSAALGRLGRRVVATDGRQTLIEALRLGIETRVFDWTSRREDDNCWDVVLGAEILYSATDIPPLARVLPELVADRGTIVLVSLARRRPLLEALAARLRADFQASFEALVLSALSPDESRVTVDDHSCVPLVVLRAVRMKGR